jgi:hypothetical protein
MDNKSTSLNPKIENLNQRSYSVRKTTPPTVVRHPSLKKGGENSNCAKYNIYIIGIIKIMSQTQNDTVTGEHADNHLF